MTGLELTLADGSQLTSHLVVVGSLLVPLGICVALWALHPPNRQQRGAIAMTTFWNALAILIVNLVAIRVGWWSFSHAGPELSGVPITLWVGWTLLWGAAAAQSPLRPVATLTVLAAIDVAYMPLMGEAIDLSSTWLIGEGVALAVCAWPGLLLNQWTRQYRRLGLRVVVQMVCFTVALMWLIPAIAVALVGRNLHLDVPYVAYGAVVVAFSAAALPGAIAVNDFYQAGGTPWPWETTAHPVRSGPYRYVRSPMQASGVMVLLVMAFIYGELVIGAAAASALAYSRIFCSIESADLTTRFGGTWRDLGMARRRWIPHFRPSPQGAKATVWVNLGCEVCAPIAEFLMVRSPTGLVVEDASDHAEPLRRIRYENEDGLTLSGAGAVGAAMEHLHFGWAMLGWLLRLPVASYWWQLIGDAVGFGPRQAVPAQARNDLVFPGGSPRGDD